MSRICQITGKKAIVGNTVSHSNNKTKRKFDINLFKKRFYLSQNKKWIRLKVSAVGIKIVNTIGIQNALKRITNGKKVKTNRIQIILECTEHKKSGKSGVSRYICTKNKKNTPFSLKLKKYNPILKKYTIHKEIK